MDNLVHQFQGPPIDNIDERLMTLRMTPFVVDNTLQLLVPICQHWMKTNMKKLRSTMAWMP